MKVKPKVMCDDIPTPAVSGWQHLITHLSSSWLPGNANVRSLCHMLSTITEILSIITALHVMQTRYCDENSVRLSVCHTREL